MMSSFLYLFGPAGCGKSTLMARALGEPSRREDKPVPHLVYAGGIQLGRDRTPQGDPTAFPGVDRISKGQHGAVLAFLNELRDRGVDVCAEGQWLAYHRFFDAMESGGWEVFPLYVAVAHEELMRRRLARERELMREITDGKKSWWKTEDTRFERLWRTRMCPMIDNTVDGAPALADHPVVRAIREGGGGRLTVLRR